MYTPTQNNNGHNNYSVSLNDPVTTINTTSDISIPLTGPANIGSGFLQPQNFSIHSTAPQRR